MKEEAEVHEKARRATATEDATEKKGGPAPGPTPASEEEPKMPPRRLTEPKKENPEKWRGRFLQSNSSEIYVHVIY